MNAGVIWGGRALLLAVFAVALSGALNPNHDASSQVPPPDVVQHIGYGYLLTLLSIASLPRVNPWWIGGAFLVVATSFDVMQIFGLVSGTFQWKDVAANVGGVAAALAPFALARFRMAGMRGAL
jgi:hypothetical protein